MLPATKRSLPSSWNIVFVIGDVGPPRTMLVEDPKAPKYAREDVASILNQKGAFATVEPPRTREVVFVFGRTKSFVALYVQSSEPAVDEGQFVPFERQTVVPPIVVFVGSWASAVTFRFVVVALVDVTFVNWPPTAKIVPEA